MSLWGTDHTATGQTNKPKWLSTSETDPSNKMECYATNQGWVISPAASGNSNADAAPEILVAIGGLAGTTATTGLRAPTITSLRWVTTATAAATRTITAEVTFDEEVTVTAPNASNNPRIVCTVGSSFPATTLAYASGTGTNRIRFSKAGVAVNNTGTCSIGGGSGNPITYAGTGAIKDKLDTDLDAAVATTGTTIATYTGTAA
jgi:hypothetical protein